MNELIKTDLADDMPSAGFMYLHVRSLNLLSISEHLSRVSIIIIKASRSSSPAGRVYLTAASPPRV